MKRITRLSAGFALISDAAMGILGGSLKRREKLSGRFADSLAWMYLASAAIKRFHEEGKKEEQLPYFQWSCEHALFNIQQALAGILVNFPNRFVGRVLSFIVFPFGKRFHEPSDHLGSIVAKGLLENHARLDLTTDIYVPDEHETGLGRLEAALKEATPALAVEAKIHKGIKSGAIVKDIDQVMLVKAFQQGIITEAEENQVIAAHRIRDEVIQVDAFTPEEYRALHG